MCILDAGTNTHCDLTNFKRSESLVSSLVLVPLLLLLGFGALAI